MENILQSLVKIIIIGSFYKTTSVDCNRQFLPPPLPYYPNENFFIPNFVPPYHEPLPVYYREENPPPPISFQNMNPYTSPQLFHRNENYNPLQFADPVVRYSPPQIFPYKPDFNQPYKTQPNSNNGVASFNYKKPSQVPLESQDRPTEATKKKPAFYATNIIIKEESQLPYYSDDYNKNYHDEDYGDNYSDESPPQPDPCMLNSPYRYFEAPKPDPNNPNVEDKYTLCSSYFQPNFGNGVYTVKMPITLLPSRFPPRVEQLIERIQNYFSTYTHQETSSPQNQTLTTSTPQSTVFESEEKVNATTEGLNKKNTTEENQGPGFEETNLNPSEAAAVAGENETTGAIRRPEGEELLSTSAPVVWDKKESEVVKQGVQTPTEFIETATTEAFVVPQEEFPVGEQQPEDQATTKVNSPGEKSRINQSLTEADMQLMEAKVLGSTTESAEMNNRTEEVFTLKEGLLQLNVTDSYG